MAISRESIHFIGGSSKRCARSDSLAFLRIVDRVLRNLDDELLVARRSPGTRAATSASVPTRGRAGLLRLVRRLDSELKPSRTITWQVVQAHDFSHACSISMPCSSRLSQIDMPRLGVELRASRADVRVRQHDDFGHRLSPTASMRLPASACATPRSMRRAAKSPVARLSASTAASSRSAIVAVAQSLRRRRARVDRARARSRRAGRRRPQRGSRRRRRSGRASTRASAQRARAQSSARVRERFLQHPRDLVVGQAVRRLDDDRRLDAGRLLARRHRQQAVGVDLERHADARRARRHRRNAAQLEARERAAVRDQLALALHHVDRHRRLAVLERRELLRARDRDRRVARDDLLDEPAHRLEPERQRDHVEQQPVVARRTVAGEQVGLDRRAERDHLVRIEVRERRLAEEFGDRAAGSAACASRRRPARRPRCRPAPASRRAMRA